MKKNTRVKGASHTLDEAQMRTFASKIPEGERKANDAMHFAKKYEVYGEKVFTYAWSHGGPHCLLATITPFMPPLSEMAIVCTVNVVEHILHIANELHKRGITQKPERLTKKKLSSYVEKVLECYTQHFYPLAAKFTLSRLADNPSLDDTMQAFCEVLKDLPNDLSPALLISDMQAILEIMLPHTYNDACKAKALAFIEKYDPIKAKPKVLSNRWKKHLTQKATKAIRSQDPCLIAFNVAWATELCKIPHRLDNCVPHQDEAA